MYVYVFIISQTPLSFYIPLRVLVSAIRGLRAFVCYDCELTILKFHNWLLHFFNNPKLLTRDTAPQGHVGFGTTRSAGN